MLRCVLKNILPINPILESIVEFIKHVSSKLPMSYLNKNDYFYIIHSVILHHRACMNNGDLYVT